MTPATTLPPLSPAMQVLLLCGRAHLDDGERARLGDLLAGVEDWDALARLAARHGLLPLVARHLAGSAAPSDFLADLERRARAQALRATTMTVELLKLVELLGGRGVDVLAFKGPSLAQVAYGDPAARSFLDLDLLVRRADVPAARAALAERGYALEDELEPWRLEATLDQGQALVLRRPPGFKLELHVRLFDTMQALPLETDVVFARSVTIALAGRRVRHLSLEDLVLYLAFHGVKHTFDRLEWLTALAETVRANPGIDWNRVRSEAARLRAERLLRASLALARDLLDAPLPDEVARAVDGDRDARALADRLAAWILAVDPADPALHRSTRLWLVGRGARARWSIVWRLAFEPKPADWDAVRLPARWRAGYYVLRPARLAWESARRLFGRS